MSKVRPVWQPESTHVDVSLDAVMAFVLPSPSRREWMLTAMLADVRAGHADCIGLAVRVASIEKRDKIRTHIKEIDHTVLVEVG